MTADAPLLFSSLMKNADKLHPHPARARRVRRPNLLATKVSSRSLVIRRDVNPDVQLVILISSVLARGHM